MIRVLVCGGRNFINNKLLADALDDVHRQSTISEIIHGGAEGADTMAGRWADRRGVGVAVYPADWEKYGRAAGPIRNKTMLEHSKPDLVVAFSGHKGTAHMVMIATDAGVPVLDLRVS